MKTWINLTLIIFFLSVSGCLSGQQTSSQNPVASTIQTCKVPKIQITDVENAKVNDYISMVRGINGVVLFRLAGINESAETNGVELKFENGSIHAYGNKKDAKIILIEKNQVQIDIFNKNLSEYLDANKLCL